MALLLVTPLRCPYTGDPIVPTPAQIDTIQQGSKGQNAVIELVCPTCGAAGRLERRQEKELAVDAQEQLALGQPVELRLNDRMRLSWSLDNISVLKTVTPT